MVDMRLRALAISLALGVAACAEPRPSRQTAGGSRGDGVEEIEVAATALDSLPVIVVDSASLQIGAADGAAAYLLHIAGAPVTLSDGRIVVPNGQAEIRYYDSAGHHERTVGRLGGGPGEYRQLWSIYRLPGDSLLVLDARLGRVDIRDGSGRFVRSQAVETQQASFPIGLLWLPDRSAVYLAGGWDRIIRRAAGPQAVTIQDTSFLIRMSLHDARSDTIGVLPADWINGASSAYVSVALAGNPLVAVSPAGIAAAHGDRFFVRWYDTSGALRRTIRALIEPRSVTAEDRAAHERTIVREVRGRAREELRLQVQYARHVPALTRLRFDMSGQLWLRRWVPDGADSVEWLVFSGTGWPAARLQLPTALRVDEIGTDYILGRFRDEDGVESVRRYRFRLNR